MTISTEEEFQLLLNRIATSAPGTLNINIDIDFNALSDPESKRLELHDRLKFANMRSLTVLNGYQTDQQLSDLIKALTPHCIYLNSLHLSQQNLGDLSLNALNKLLTKRTGPFALNISQIPLGDQVLPIIRNLSRVGCTLNMSATHPIEGHSYQVAQAIHSAVASSGAKIQIANNYFQAVAFAYLGQTAWTTRYPDFRSCYPNHRPDVPTTAVATTTSTTSTTTTSATVPAPSEPAPVPKIYFAVSEKTIYRNYLSRWILPTSEEALTALKGSARCRVYATEQMAVTKSNSKIRPSSFFDGSYYPVHFKITTTTDIQLCDDIPLENHHIDAALFYSNNWSQGVLLRSRYHEEELRNVVLAAYDAYALLHTSSTNTSSGADEGAGMCSTTGSADRRETKASHTQAGVDRAMDFKESLTGLEYVELIKALRDYAEGWFNGGFEKGESFKPILYEKLIEKYGTVLEKGFLASKTLIDKGDLLDALNIADKAIVADVTAKMTPAATAAHRY